MGNYMGITCLKIKHALGDARRRLLPKGRKNYHKLPTRSATQGDACYRRDARIIITRSATQGDACYRRDARIIINIKK